MTAEPVGDRLSLDRVEVEQTIGDENGAYINVPGFDHGLILFRTEAGYEAISATCTHLSCRLRPSGETLLCPCHGSTFARDGSVLRGPAQMPLATYPVAVDAGRVEILLTPTTR